MKKIEREILHRIRCLNDAIPLPVMGGSTKSAAMTGFASFAQDMAEMRPHIEQVWSHLYFQEYEECNVLLSAIEAWIEMRKGQNWELPSSLFPKGIEHFRSEIEQQRAQESEESNG
jgi:hypothetical protein